MSNPLRGFLIDGSVYGGSSGSLIMLKPYIEMDVLKNLRWIKRGSYVIGILSRGVSSKGTNLNLGVVFSSENILELLNQL